jgi:hypothetical protein
VLRLLFSEDDGILNKDGLLVASIMVPPQVPLDQREDLAHQRHRWLGLGSVDEVMALVRVAIFVGEDVVDITSSFHFPTWRICRA